MLPRFEPRPEPSRLAGWLAPLWAVLATVVVGLVLFSLLGKDPAEALYVFFVKPLATRYGVGELLQKAGPLMLCAVGLAAGYRANVWNIGAEGQLTIGGLAAGALALAFADAPAALLLPAMFVAGALGGMAWAAIPAWLRTRFNANEILTSLMLVYIATYLLSYCVNGPLRDPEGFNFPQSRLFAQNALLPNILSGTRLNAGFVVALAVVAMLWLFMQRSYAGFRMRVAGLAPAAATYTGISLRRTVWMALLIGGACAGVAGTNEVAGPLGPAAALDLAGLRLRGDHRRIRGAAAPRRHRRREPAHVAALSRRRVGAGDACPPERGHGPVPGHAAVLPARGGRLHPLSRAPRRAGGDRDRAKLKRWTRSPSSSC